jgi:hypothetical protein
MIGNEELSRFTTLEPFWFFPPPLLQPSLDC